MISKEKLREIIFQQKALHRPEHTIPRDLLAIILNLLEDKRVFVISGIRRCGKSTLLRQIMEKTKNHCYVNFEDERFLDFAAQDFEQLNEVLVEIYGNANTYFFDEIQNVDKFELFVRRLHEQGKKVILTGSNASLLSKELGTRLTGRYKLFEIYPFSFGEYLKLKEILPTNEWFYSTEKKTHLIGLFDAYLTKGGLPEYLKNDDSDYVRTVYENILYRDVIARYSIKKQRLVKELVGILTANISAPFTYNSLKNSLGLANSITVKEYISYLSNSYLFFELQRFDFSIRKMLNAPKKIYLIDPAFHQIGSLSLSLNKGRLLENAVFIELKRRGKEVYYNSGENECDFLIKDAKKISEAIQVCYELNDENKSREIKGLVEALNKFGLGGGLILTHDQEMELRESGKVILVTPLWKWLLRY